MRKQNIQSETCKSTTHQIHTNIISTESESERERCEMGNTGWLIQREREMHRVAYTLTLPLIFLL